MKRLILLITIALMMTNILSGCALVQKPRSVISIPDPQTYTWLYFQGVNQNGKATKSTEKFISDKQKIQSFIKQVNKLKVTEPSSTSLAKKDDELNHPGNYIVALAHSKTLDDSEVYYMYLFRDGSIQFQDPNQHKLIYLSKSKYPNKIKKIKAMLNINF